MAARVRVRENWFTQKPNSYAWNLVIFLGALLASVAAFYLTGSSGAAEWMPATGEAVFGKREYYRLWTTLFAHGDFSHLLSNSFLFFPLAYFLSAHFSLFVFPVLAIALGGLTNFLVLKTLPPGVTLIGISGVVYWMGAAWLTLFLLIDRRERLRRRLGTALFLFLMLFVPERIRPEVSYLSHAVGFLSGMLSALVIYAWNRKKYAAAEIRERIPEPVEADDELTQLALAAGVPEKTKGGIAPLR